MANARHLASLTVLLLSRHVCAHGGLNNYSVGDTWYRGYDPFTPAEDQLGQPWQVQRAWDTIDPIFDVDSPYLSCNTPGTTAAASIPIVAGDNITAYYYYWLHPVGPMSVWLAACPESTSVNPNPCADFDPKETDWFKIWHAGLTDDGSAGLEMSMWYQKAFQRWDNEPAAWPVQIPGTLRPGVYLIRHEIMSIHVAGKPQFYPECAHLNVSGNGSAMPSSEWFKRFPGVYSMDDPVINIDIYSEESRNTHTYDPPGGPVWQG